MPAGPVASAFTWAAYQAELKDYLFIEAAETSYDVTLQRLVKAAAKKADEYLMNSFEDLTPRITVASPEANDQVEINGCAFTAKAAADADDDEREFAIGVTNDLTAQALVDLINSDILGGVAAIGVPGVTATRSGAVITLGKRYDNVTNITCSSSDDDRLRVDIYRVAATVPDDVILWCQAFVAWRFENRDGKKSERTESGVTGMDWGDKPAMDLLEPYAMQYAG
jgi:hypothetical protein